MVLLLVLGCPQSTGFQKPDDSTPTDDSGWVTTTPLDDTADTDGDLDGDGFTVEEGDCDDTDVHANPAREEDDRDGIDNDCDGKVDEAWAGVTVVHYDGGGADLFTVDAGGFEEDRLPVTGEECYPIWLDHYGEDWLVNNNYAMVTVVDGATGACTDLGDFSDAEVYPYGVYGIVTGADGLAYATTLDKLYRVDADGTITEVATWPCDLMDPTAHELAAYSLAVDPLTGEIGLFGYFGGFATWSEAAGVTMYATEDLQNPAVYTWSGAHRDGGGWFSPGATADGMAVLRFDLATSAWVEAESWEDEDWSPFMLALDSDEGDFYVTATAGWYATIWRIVHGSGYAADLYITSGAEPENFYGIVSEYTYGG